MENIKFKNQMEAVKWHLKNNEKLSSMEAFSLYSITRLSAKIHLLRKSGWNIVSKYVKCKNRYGLNSSYSDYYLIKDEKN